MCDCISHFILLELLDFPSHRKVFLFKMYFYQRSDITHLLICNNSQVIWNGLCCFFKPDEHRNNSVQWRIGLLRTLTNSSASNYLDVCECRKLRVYNQLTIYIYIDLYFKYLVLVLTIFNEGAYLTFKW